MTTQRIRDYELVMVLSPQASDEEVAATVERVDTFITERGGELSDQQNWGLRRLAYPIQNFQEGNYILKRFNSDPDSILQLDRTLNASEDVLRHLVTKAVPPNIRIVFFKPSAKYTK